MKKLLKILFRILLFILGFIVLLIVLVCIKSAFTKFVPENYTELVKTGGSIEAEYLSMGEYEVSCHEKKVEDSARKVLIFYPTVLENTQREFPVVVFVNGTGVVASKYTALFEHLASWGFVVVGNEEQESWNGNASETSLCYLLSENQNPDSVFYQKIDTQNIGVSGHSQGGAGVFTTITEHEHSDLYKTAIALSPTNEEQAISLQWSYDLTKITIPIMLLAGTEGDFETQMVIPLEKMEEMYDKISAPKLMARRVDSEHGEMLYEADGYVTAWFMWQLQGDLHAASAFVGEKPEIMTNHMYINQNSNISE